MRTRTIILLAAVLICCGFYTSARDSRIFERLQALSNNGTVFYNIDGVSITRYTIDAEFTKANICRLFRDYVSSEAALSATDPLIAQRNFIVERVDSVCDDVNMFTTYYYIEHPAGKITEITYSSPGKLARKLQETLNPLILHQNVPDSVFSKQFFNTINFAGRKLSLGTYSCRWTNVNSVQWPYHGEMNWSVHRDSLSAALAVDMQRKITCSCKAEEMGATVVSDENIAVLFEGAAAQARKVVLDIGSAAAALKASGGGGTRQLILYYVAAPVRGNWISCVMSYWNNDFIEESGLPSLLEKVMALKE